MNTLTSPVKPSKLVKRSREVYDEPEASQSRLPATTPGPEATSDAGFVPSPTLHSIVHDSHGAHLENFPFAFTMFAVLITGVTATLSGILLTRAWLAVIGFCTTLTGCALYGWSLYDD